MQEEIIENQFNCLESLLSHVIIATGPYPMSFACNGDDDGELNHYVHLSFCFHGFKA